MKSYLLSSIAALGLLASVAPSLAQQAAAADPMTFFITSAGSGKGGDLGGLEGADKICQTLAASAGGGSLTWHAYLSTSAFGGGTVVNARDRIGKGPWHNAKGVLIARSVDELHGANNNLTKQTALTEKGAVVSGRGDPVNTHDILTGSRPDGTAMARDADTTCKNWTSSTEGAAMLGHSDRTGLDTDPPSISWSSAHLSRGGCSPDALKSSGGAGLLYCFAVR